MRRTPRNPRRWLMRGECGANTAAQKFHRENGTTLPQQWRPSRVGPESRRRHALLVAAGYIDREQLWTGIAPRITEEHQQPAVGRPSRALVVKPFCQYALAGAVRTHDADGKPALRLLGECNVIPARRPHRRRIGAVAKAHPRGRAR